MVTCGQCALWIAPGKEYESNSTGLCYRMVHFENRHNMKNKHISTHRYDEFYSKLGGKIYNRDIPRNCEFFEKKK